MPHHVVTEVVLALPFAGQPIEPRQAFIVARLHLQHVRHGVGGPDVRRVGGHGCPPEGFGFRIVTGLFQAECIHAEQIGIVRVCFSPGIKHPRDRIAHGAIAPGVEVHVVRNAQPGSIVVFHDSLKAQEKLEFALPQVLAHFRELGYNFAALTPELLSNKRVLQARPKLRTA